MAQENKRKPIEERMEKYLQILDRAVPLRAGLLDICTWDKQWLNNEPKRNYSKRREINCALMLQQLIYWTDRTAPKNGKWIAKSAREWEEEIGLTESEARSAQFKLEYLRFIETRTGPFKAKKTTWYRIIEENITDALIRRMELRADELGLEEGEPVLQERKPVFNEL